MALSGAFNSTLGRKRYAIRTYGDAVSWLLSKYATHATMAHAYKDIITTNQRDNEAPTAFSHRVETQCDLLNGLFNIQDVKDVFITGLLDLVQAHVRVLSDQFPDRTISETVATAQLYWDGTNKLRLQLKMTRPTAIQVAYATKDQRTMTERPFTQVRTPPPPPAAVPEASRADICYNCNKPGHLAAQCAEPYRPRERRQPPVGVHAIADGDTADEEIEHPVEAVEDSKKPRPGARLLVARRDAKAYGGDIVAPCLTALRDRRHAWPVHACDAELPPCTGHGHRGEHSAS